MSDKCLRQFYDALPTKLHDFKFVILNTYKSSTNARDCLAAFHLRKKLSTSFLTLSLPLQARTTCTRHILRELCVFMSAS